MALSWHLVLSEFKSILDYSSLIIFVQMSYMMAFPISLFFIGPLGTLLQDAAGLGNTVFHATGILIIAGFSSAADTTMAQSYGTRNKYMVGVYMQKGIMISLLLSFLSMAVILNSEWILKLLGQDEEVVQLTAKYTAVVCPCLLVFSVWVNVSKFFRSQGVFWIILASQVPNIVVSILGHYVFINVLGYGLLGSAIAQILGYSTATALSVWVGSCQTQVLEKTWAGFSKESFLDWGTYTVMGLAGIVILCSQWWALEISTILAGTMGRVELAAQAIVFQVNYFFWTVPVGIGYAVNILIAHKIGADQPFLAKLDLVIGGIFVIFVALILSLLLVAVRKDIGPIFSHDRLVIALIEEVVPYMALFRFFDSIAQASLGICRGLAKQKMGALISATCIYGVGIPFAVYFGFHMEFGVKGLWLGLSIGLVVEVLLLALLILRTNWQEECEGAQLRAGIVKEDAGNDETYENNEENSSESKAEDDSQRLQKQYEAVRPKRIAALVLCTVVLIAGVAIALILEFTEDTISLQNYNGTVS